MYTYIKVSIIIDKNMYGIKYQHGASMANEKTKKTKLQYVAAKANDERKKVISCCLNGRRRTRERFRGRVTRAHGKTNNNNNLNITI